MEEHIRKNKFNFGDTLYHPEFSEDGRFLWVSGPLTLESIQCVRTRPCDDLCYPPRIVGFTYKFLTGDVIEERELYTSKEAAEKAVVQIVEGRIKAIKKSIEELEGNQ